MVGHKHQASRLMVVCCHLQSGLFLSVVTRHDPSTMSKIYTPLLTLLKYHSPSYCSFTSSFSLLLVFSWHAIYRLAVLRRFSSSIIFLCKSAPEALWNALLFHKWYINKHMPQQNCINGLHQGTICQQHLPLSSGGPLSPYLEYLGTMNRTWLAFPIKLVAACASPCRKIADELAG